MVSTGPCAQDEPLNLNSSNDKLFNFSIYFSHQILCLYGTISWKVWQEKLTKPVIYAGVLGEEVYNKHVC